MITIDDMRGSVAILQNAIDHVQPSQMSATSPCEGWATRDVINHVIGGAHMFTAAALGQSMGPMDGPMPDFVGANPSESFRAAAGAAIDAMARPDFLEKEVALPFGNVPAPVALSIACGDLLVHAWDIATATGQTITVSEDLASKALAFFQATVGPELRTPGVFGPEVDAPSGASTLDQLVYFTGRHPK